MKLTEKRSRISMFLTEPPAEDLRKNKSLTLMREAFFIQFLYVS